MSNPSAGTITFLCIDIQARVQAVHTRSTSLSLDHYTTILNQAINACGGSIFKFSDGSVYTAFPSAQAAVSAALASYWTMYTQSWGDTDMPFVHMALHTGPAGRYNTTYVGPTFNHAVSLLAACRNGQILLSRETYEQIATLPTGTEIQDIGERRLKDLTRPEHIYQLLPHHRPPDVELSVEPDPFPINLPVLPSPLIGRDREVNELRSRLRSPHIRLLTLLGSSGTGKTRLSLQLAVEMASEFVDGVYFVPLAPIGSATLVDSAIAQALDLRETGERPLHHAIIEHLRNRQVLLILDNFEQLTDAAPVIESLLNDAPDIKILITSQASIGISSEYVFPVPPLALPDLHQLPPLDQLTGFPSIALFLMRAQVVKHDFALTVQNATSLAELCVRLSGIPLAIELMAAYADLFTPQEMLDQMSKRLAEATTSHGDELTHKQILNEVLKWSFDLLDPSEQTLLARMGVFSGGATLEAAIAVSDDVEADTAESPPARPVFDVLQSLFHKNLLVQEQWLSNEPRYVMLDMIHHFAEEQLQRYNEFARLRDAHANYCISLAEQGEAGLTGAQQEHWLKRLEDDIHNLRAALVWMLDRNKVEQSLRLSGLLWRFWYIRGYLSEGRRWLTLALNSSQGEPSQVHIKALSGASVLSFIQGDYQKAMDYAEQHLRLVRTLGDTKGTANALNNLGVMAVEQGEFARAIPLLAENLDLRRELDDTWGIAAALNNLGRAAEGEQDYERAETYYAESISLFRHLSDKSNTVNPLSNLGWLALLREQLDEARDMLTESLQLAYELGYQEGIATSIQGLAHLASLDGHRVKAARLLGVVDKMHRECDIQLSPLDSSRYQITCQTIQSRVDEATYATAWAEGQTLSLDHVVQGILNV
jgi:predicted ATPase/class 3 adenylate cyclase